MAPLRKYSPVLGELVFAKVKGHMPWPARVTSVQEKSFGVMFYGTFETSPALKANMLWPYNQENVEKFSKKGIANKSFKDGLDQIKETPEILPSGYAVALAGEAGHGEEENLQIEPVLHEERQIQIQKVKIKMEGVEIKFPDISIKIGNTSVEVPTEERYTLDAVTKKMPEMVAELVSKVATVHHDMTN